MLSAKRASQTRVRVCEREQVRFPRETELSQALKEAQPGTHQQVEELKCGPYPVQE